MDTDPILGPQEDAQPTLTQLPTQVSDLKDDLVGVEAVYLKAYSNTDVRNKLLGLAKIVIQTFGPAIP
jgi:hypothetical protein